MLNISANTITDKIDKSKFDAIIRTESRTSGKTLLRILSAFGVLMLVVLFIPWTQNIRSMGNVTALRPDQRPQSLHSVIDGRIEKWFVQEGDFVKRGDTILFISEIKDEYFDPNLLSRTKDQLKSKELSVSSYMEKIRALDTQIDALVETSELKLQQAKNKLQQAHLKVASDSIDLDAAKTKLTVAERQLERTQKLQDDGLKSIVDVENKRVSFQKAQADAISAENKWLAAKNELINAKVELTSIKAQYRDDIAKAESDKFTALSNMYDAEAQVTKLQNQYVNYEVRNGLYYITAPQDGYITEAQQTGIGENVKAGTALLSLMPANYELAVEMYVRPIDLPLLEKGQHVRIQFDGWPAIVFSGWPNTSYGTYGGEVYAIDNFISPNGKYRVLVAPSKDDHTWPHALRVGAGTNNMVLLKDVPIWYELWRQINGFPPDYYKTSTPTSKEEKK